MTRRDRRPSAPAPIRRLVDLYRVTVARLPLLYLCWAILVGSIVAWVTPPWQNPDEAAHAERAIQVGLSGIVGRRVGPRNAGGLTDPGVNASAAAVAALPFHSQLKASAAMLAAAEAVKPGRPAIAAFDNTATYPPFLYAAAVAAGWIGRHAHMHVAATLRLMRLVDVLAAAALGAAAIATAQRTQLAITATLLLPMSLALAASPSQDALLLPLAAWAVAAIDRARSDADAAPLGLARQCVVAGALLLAILARPPYLPLAALLLSLPGGRAWPRHALAAAISALVLLWSAYVGRRISVAMYLAAPSGQTAWMLHHPLGFLGVATASLADYGQSWAAGMVGVFGWTDTPLPASFVSAAEGVLALSLLSAALPEPVQAGGWRRRTLPGWCAVAAAFAALLAAIYVIWCAPGATTIYGVQGRYFLPLLPALALGMPDLGRWAAAFRPLALVAVLLLAVVGPVVTVVTLVERYYLMP